VNSGLWEQGNERVDYVQTRNLMKTEQLSASHNGPRSFNKIFSRCDVF
jgi:hypothetical protein